MIDDIAMKKNSSSDGGVDIYLSRNRLFENRIDCEWLSTEQAANFLSISANALRILVHRNQIPAYKFGRRLRFKLHDCLTLFQKKGV